MDCKGGIGEPGRDERIFLRPYIPIISGMRANPWRRGHSRVHVNRHHPVGVIGGEVNHWYGTADGGPKGGGCTDDVASVPTDRGVSEDRVIVGEGRNCEEQFGGDWETERPSMVFLDNRLLDVGVSKGT